MVNPSTHTVARPSGWWYIAGVIFGLGAIIAVIAAVLYQASETRPIGEGALFLEEAEWVAEELAPDSSDETAVRRIRNHLEIEAVSLVAPDGTISDSTSPTLVDTIVDLPVISFAHSIGTFAAVAVPMTHPVVLDGVEEWKVGDTLYAVIHPMDDGSSILLHYEISELLNRRLRDSGIAPGTLWLATAALFLAVLSAMSFIGRSRAATRFDVIERESELLRDHAAELEESNRQLDAARSAAEDALALAEEKNRIRSEFVLMINHELRTPLTSVLTGARLLAEPDLDDDVRQAIIEDMLRDGGRLEQMISQILVVARVENRGLMSTVADIDAATVWDRITTHLSPDTFESLPVGLGDLTVRTDPDTLSQLVASLVDNAFQHGASRVTTSASTETAIDPDVVVGSPVTSALVVSVRDDGPGIDASFMPRIFEKFEKDSFSSGTGLGLYLARLMAEAIDCSISVASSPSGTTFEIAVPLVEQRVEVMAT